MGLSELKHEVDNKYWPYTNHVFQTLYVRGFDKNPNQSNVLRRADGVAEIFTKHKKVVYENDIILGSGCGIKDSDENFDEAAVNRYYNEIKIRDFPLSSDHFAPNYARFLSEGIPGTKNRILASIEKHKDNQDQVDFLNAMMRCLDALSNVLVQYADIADEMGKTESAEACRAVAYNAPATFQQAVQLMYIVHTMFTYESRYAMAFGRMDQFLYPYYKADIEKGAITPEKAQEMLACMFYKFKERPMYFWGDDVSNIAIGGVKPEDGSDATNELSFIILRAVNDAHIPGPNLSARINKDTPMEFIDECLKVIGTGLGYPAMMNDDANIAALHRVGLYSLEDCRDYCMVGCIENFIQGKQPPWTDGIFNSPKYFMYALNDGINTLNGEQESIHTGKAEDIKSMDELLNAYVQHMDNAVEKYAERVHTVAKVDAINLQQPFLSIFCDDCIDKALDINMGGAKYPAAHGVGVVGVATISDSLAAIEKLVFNDKVMTLAEMRDILNANFVGYEKERQMMLDCPKYGNNDDFVDKWAVWFVDAHADVFDKYHTPSGGPIGIAIATNVLNISAGWEIGATPDGRCACEPVSDAASPMYGRDVNGPTAALLSTSKPDYSKAYVGTVVNQKYPPSMFTDEEKRKKLGALVRVYFNRGGQELQINSTSSEILRDAMENPDNYRSLVVRVSGFSAYYTNLNHSVQTDILNRTEHESI